MTEEAHARTVQAVRARANQRYVREQMSARFPALAEAIGGELRAKRERCERCPLGARNGARTR